MTVTRVDRHLAAPRARVYAALVDPAYVAPYTGRLERLVPGELVREVDEFVTDDPALSGAMTITITLTDAAGGGTDLVAVHEGVPDGVSPKDNETGWHQALDRLASLTETG